MTEVTVNLDDLERIIYAASAIKQIEASLAAFKRDPFVKPHLDFTEAQKRLETTMRAVKRAQSGTMIKYDEPLSLAEGRILSSLAMEDHGQQIIRSGDYRFNSLGAKGCVIIGQLVTGAIFPGADQPELSKDPLQLVVKITDRGRKRLPPLWQLPPTQPPTKPGFFRLIWDWLSFPVGGGSRVK